MRSKQYSLRERLLTSIGGSRLSLYACLTAAGVASALVVAAPDSAKAFNLYDGSQYGNNLVVNLDITTSYTGDYRVNDPSKLLLGENDAAFANGNDGDQNFKHGIVGNLFEVLPVLDIKDGNYGAHFSGQAYINTPYLGTNSNSSPSTLNPLSVQKNTDFTSATRNVNGEQAQFLDAFVFATHQFSEDQSLSLKVGRQTLLWGQSLFFTNNGIAAGQAPIDIITADNIPNAQAQQIFLPVGQVVVTYQAPGGSLTLQGYYQFEYQHDTFEGSGSYFSTTDILDKGGQRLIIAPGEYINRLKDLTPPSQNGQFGISVQDTFGIYDVGLYALRFDSKAPETEGNFGPGTGTLTPGGIFIGNYRLVYPRDISIYGASVSTVIGAANVAVELSGRENMPLVAPSSFTVVSAPSSAGASSDAAYPVGSTIAAQVSALYDTPAVPLIPGGISFAGEVEFNHLVSVTKNRANLSPGRQASAAAFDVVATPTWNDVLPSLQIQAPIGIEYNFLGRSEIDQTMEHGTGNLNIGITATYEGTWIAALNYKDYLGKPIAIYNELADRGYVSLNLQHTF